MTKTEYEAIRARIDQRYHQDVAALERIWSLFRDEKDPPPAAGIEGQKASRPKPAGQEPSRQKLSSEEKHERNLAYMRDWRARKKAGLTGSGRRTKGDAAEKGVKNFAKFLVAGPASAGGNGGE